MQPQLYNPGAEDNAVQTFDFNGLTLRALLVEGEPWFIGADVARVLEYRTASDMFRGVDEEDKGYAKVRTPGGDQRMITVNESGLYTAIVRANADRAKPFRRWVTAEVLPAIRKTGSYGGQVQLPQSYSEALRELASTVEAKERLELENAKMKPIVQEFDEFMGARGTFTAE